MDNLIVESLIIMGTAWIVYGILFAKNKFVFAVSASFMALCWAIALVIYSIIPIINGT